jgi:hypothetical protein
VYNSRGYARNPTLLHQNSASCLLMSSAMSDNIIPPSEVELLLRPLIFEAIPIVGYFVSADESVRVVLRGFVIAFTSDEGLLISTTSPVLTPDRPSPVTIIFPQAAKAV